MHIRCPHCHNPIEVVEQDSLSDVTCPSCGSTFNLISGDTTQTHHAKTHRVAHFELLDQVGLGAFGAVWKARDTVLQRTVALKIPRRGQVTAEEAEYFFRDARAAAQLTHPGIVSVYEVGRDGDTLYIASKFIEGATLADWIEAHPLTPLEAAVLLVKVAEAIQHAHERGVIHRDLKPGNILLDNNGEPHVADFGLAKRDAGEITMTVDGQVLGTPAYMSPEQARGHGHQADARSDVYSLGVILFQLLTGELPFRGSKAMLVVQILNDEPPSPRKLNGRVSCDLETICLKAMAKEPERRYVTARDMAEDLKRYLAGRPIHARSIGGLERAWRWSKRNPRLAGLWATILLLLSATAVVSTAAAWRIALAREDEAEARNKAVSISIREQAQRVRAEEAEKAALKEADRANLQAAVAKRVSETLAGMYQGADPVGLSGYSLGTADKVDVGTTAVEILDRGAKKVREDTEKIEQELVMHGHDGVPANLAIQLAVQAKLMDTIGNVYTSYMRFDDAEPLLTKALDLRRRSFGDRNLAVAESLHSLAVFHFFEGDFDAAERYAGDALAIRRKELGERNLDVALSEFALGWTINFNLGERQADAESLMRSAIETRVALLGPDHRDVGYARFGLAAILTKMGRAADAAQELLGAASVIARASGDKRIGETVALYSRGLVAQSLRDFKAMEDANRQAVAKLADVFGESHPIVSYVRRDLADALVSRGDARAAEQLYRETLDIDRRSLGRRPFVGHSLAAFGKFLLYQHRFDEAERMYSEALDILSSTLDPDSGHVAHFSIEAAGNDQVRGDYASAERRCLAAAQILERARPQLRAIHAPSVWFTLSRVALVNDDADLYRRACEELVRLHTDKSDPEYSKAIAYTCSWSSGALADPEIAVRMARRAMAKLNDLPWSQQDLGAVLYRAGNYHDAVQELTGSIARQGNDGHLPGQVFLAMAHQRLNQSDNAIRWLEKAEAWHAARFERKSRDDAERAAKGGPADYSKGGDASAGQQIPHPFIEWDETVLFGHMLKEAQNLIRGETTVLGSPGESSSVRP